VLFLAVVVACVPLVVGFAALYLGAYAADSNIGAYRADQGLPPRDRADRWTFVLAAYAGGVVLSLLVIVLVARWYATGRWRGALILALLGGIGLGLVLAVDGLLHLTPSGAVADLVPTWYAPLSVAQGLGTVVVFGLAVMALPQRSPVTR
jgi:hypothetical protein